ncbi:hypothetical protein a10_05775 [Streptomyces acidiscabies]|nr:hypothetical protein a10_05775 [Streptomyces acidiscabies]GAV42719.1 hypothetical protein Saa2_05663 [Streptomyces acidiscabies]
MEGAELVGGSGELEGAGSRGLGGGPLLWLQFVRKFVTACLYSCGFSMSTKWPASMAIRKVA